MKRNWISNLIVAGIVGMLTVFLVLQYNWLSEASAAERERMQRRVEADTRAFADEFNREVQAAFFNFQTNAESFESGDFAEFNERYDFWRQRTAYPELVQQIVYFPSDTNALPLRYDPADRRFVEAGSSERLIEIRGKLTNVSTRAFVEEDDMFVLPILPNARKIERILVRPMTIAERRKIEMPDPAGHMVISLDREVITGRMLPDLAAKYFGSGEYKLAVSERSGKNVFGESNSESKPDANAGLMDMKPDSMIFFANRELSLPRSAQPGPTGVVVNRQIESHTFSKTEVATTEKTGKFTIELKGDGDEKARTTVLAATTDGEPPWKLQTTHTAGSIDAYISGQKRKSFAVGLGVYLLLVGSILAIVISAQHSRRYAQRQIDFVSSVSHEFRTPLAVIYSAGENLADGVAKDDKQVLRYGELIKGEGKKLSGMVEQILEFAGARSGKRKYSFAEISVSEIIESALQECSSAIDDRGVVVETEIAETLPSINADRSALSQAVQNLILNSVKYGNGNKWLRISATNGNGVVKIAVEDRGIGIKPDELKQIFEPFYRSKDVVDAQIHGNGLGLSLVREIAEAHGGTVRAESEIGKGSKFTIEIPV